MFLLTSQEKATGLPLHPDQMRSSKMLIVIAGVFSLVVHLSLLVFFNPSYVPTRPTEAEAVSTILSLEVRRSPRSSALTIPLPDEPEQGRLEETLEAAAPTTQTSAEAVEPASETLADIDKKRTDVPVVTSSGQGERTTALITTLPNSESTGSVGEACDPQQQASGIRLCSTMPDHAAIAAGSQQFDGAFKDAFAHLNSTGGFRTDMVNLELLLAQWNQLEELANLGVVDASVVAVRQREVSAQIEQIYARYEEIDLIKVIAATSQATKNIAKAVMGQKD